MMLRRAVLIGPECTGKTWLAAELAKRYGVVWSPEYVREFVNAKREPVVYNDVDTIGRGQKAGEDAVIARAERLGLPLVLLDTDLVSTMVYSRHYYGDCPEWIESEARERLGDLYLLLHVDVPWTADGHQREQPERRKELFEFFHSTLSGFGAKMADVRGSWETRKQTAFEAVDRLLKENSHGW
jgi:NadR type nicotinamide-nucleotide adenylyltransferase